MAEDGKGISETAISPDSQKIAFSEFPIVGEDGVIKVLNANGTGLAELTLTSGHINWEDEISFSPDSSKVTFNSYIVNINDSGLSQIVNGYYSYMFNKWLLLIK